MFVQQLIVHHDAIKDNKFNPPDRVSKHWFEWVNPPAPIVIDTRSSYRSHIKCCVSFLSVSSTYRCQLVCCHWADRCLLICGHKSMYGHVQFIVKLQRVRGQRGSAEERVFGNRLFVFFIDDTSSNYLLVTSFSFFYIFGLHVNILQNRCDVLWKILGLDLRPGRYKFTEVLNEGGVRGAYPHRLIH